MPDINVFNNNLNSKILSISVIIVNWNTRVLTANCIQSILDRSDNLHMEIFVVDNASTDDSVEYLSRRFSNIKIIKNKANEGFAKGNNKILSDITSDFYFLINSDVIVHSGCFENLISLMIKNKNIAIAGPQILSVDGKIQRSTMSVPTFWLLLSCALGWDKLFRAFPFFSGYMMWYFDHRTPRVVDIVNGAFWIVRERAIRHVGIMDERYFMYAEDMDWCFRFKKAGWLVWFEPTAQITHLEGSSSKGIKKTSYMRMKKANLQFWSKFHSELSVNIYIIIGIIHELVRLTLYALRYFFNFNRKTDKYLQYRQKFCRFKTALVFYLKAFLKSVFKIK